MEKLLLLLAFSPLIVGSFVTADAFGCQTHAIGCQKNAEPGSPAGNSPPEVSGCHFFDTQQCVRESTPP